MEAKPANRPRSRILREMNANRLNPFNSPPSSTGSHGTISPTLSTVFSDIEDSTRMLNKDIARVTAPRKLTVNWDAAGRKWPGYFSSKASGSNGAQEHKSAKENKQPATRHNSADDSTDNFAWQGVTKTRAEMQPRVDNDSSSLSAILSKPPTTRSASRHHVSSKKSANAASMPKVQNGSLKETRQSLYGLQRQLNASHTPKHNKQTEARGSLSPNTSSAKSSLTAVARSPNSLESPKNNIFSTPSILMPDVSHLEDFITGTLKFHSMDNKVPIFVKHGKVHDRQQNPSADAHAFIDGIEIPEDEKNIFVSMDMIRDEILSLQDHYDSVQEYAKNLQQHVEQLELQLKSRNKVSSSVQYSHENESTERNSELQDQVAKLQTQLEQCQRRANNTEKENESLVRERDRIANRLQTACEEINKLACRLTAKEREVETSHKKLENTDQILQDNDTLQRNLVTLRHGRDNLELDNTTLRQENESLRKKLAALKSDVEHDDAKLRQENESLRKKLATVKSSFEVKTTTLRQENESLREELATLKSEMENMTSAFFVPDITMESNAMDQTQPEVSESVEVSESMEVSVPLNVTAQKSKAHRSTRHGGGWDEETQNKNGHEQKQQQRSKHKKGASTVSKHDLTTQSQQKVKFSIPEKPAQDDKHAANKKSKRRSAGSHGSGRILDPFQDLDDTSCLSSFDDTTQDHAVPLNVNMVEQLSGAEQDGTTTTRHGRNSQGSRVVETRTVGKSSSVPKDGCPALSNDARRVLDRLCEHNCRNCIVCSRIASHGGVVSRSDVAAGKKRVTVPRPVPVSDLVVVHEDQTIRPAQCPGYALALAIKTAQDKARHLQLELTQVQARYDSLDACMGRKERNALFDKINKLLKRLDSKKDEIYNLYDVLEGQKVAGQAMSDQEVEMTILNITGMTVRDLTLTSEQTCPQAA
ncbi:hypothetical protein CDD81_7874 [Ophiocordyceps australis]|uniref:Cep57 centrosome microtubule-binding domain-containing protein n=1 Tax=Ophiocordyceps australis TaxID=1399860 RepID=A0A2C5YHA4_9HYPO|nr:hypothetical protein CDD81_7874 [Ophiocordyceps australis]